MRGLILAVMVLGLITVVGCSSSDPTDPPPVAKDPVFTQVTDNDYFEGNPTYSPDDQWVLFESMASGNSDIWRVPVAGGAAEQLTDDLGEDTVPSWNPDGTKFVFESDRSGTKDLWIYDIGAGGIVSRLTSDDGGEGSPCWSPDGSTVVFESDRAKAGGSDLWSVPATGGAMTRITLTPSGVEIRNADFSPDGTTLVFEYQSNDLSALFTVPASGGAMTQLTFIQGYEGHPCFSPDGLEVAFESTVTGDSQIYTVAAAGGETFRVTNAGGYWPQYAHDGDTLVFCVPEGVQFDVWTMTVTW